MEPPADLRKIDYEKTVREFNKRALNETLEDFTFCTQLREKYRADPGMNELLEEINTLQLEIIGLIGGEMVNGNGK